MKKSVILFFLILSLQVFAGDHSIDFGGRSDWKLRNNDIDKTGTPNSSSFEINYLLASFSGKISPTYSYFISADFLQSSSSPDIVNGVSDFIDEAFISKTLSDGMSLSVGKKAILIGGREYDYFPYDLYTTSYFYQATPINDVGLTLTKEVGEQLWMFQFFNGNKTNVSSKPSVNTQSKFGYSVGWYGNLIDKFLKPVVAYTVVPKGVNGIRLSKGDDVYIGAGVQVNTPHNFVLEVDYGMLTQNHFGGEGIHQKTKSIVGLIRYTGENYMPFFKMISDVITLDSNETDKRSAFDVGVEYKPSNDDLVSYHIVYTGESSKSNVDSSPTTVTVGLKFDASLLK
jgi:hypothetical protein